MKPFNPFAFTTPNQRAQRLETRQLAAAFGHGSSLPMKKLSSLWTLDCKRSEPARSKLRHPKRQQAAAIQGASR